MNIHIPYKILGKYILSLENEDGDRVDFDLREIIKIGCIYGDHKNKYIVLFKNGSLQEFFNGHANKNLYNVPRDVLVNFWQRAINE